MTEKEQKKALMKSKHSIGGSSCYLSITPHKENLKEAICEVCDRVFKTDEDIYICPDCQEKPKSKLKDD